MKITDISSEFTPARVTGPADDPNVALPPRSAGLHLSQIYGDIERTLDPSLGQMNEQELAWYRNGGFLWERIYAKVLGDCFTRGDIVRPGELYKDGIIGSPDNLDTRTWTVVETKATWKSVRKFDDHLEKWFWVWLVQMKGYCHMVDAKVSELYAIFMMGDYRGSGPLVRAKRFEWTEQELWENWEMIKKHARRRGWL